MKIYFRNKSIPELQGLSPIEQNQLIMSIKPKWYEIVATIAAFYFSYQVAHQVAYFLITKYDNDHLSVAAAFLICGMLFYSYLIFALNFITRKKLATKLNETLPDEHK